MNDIQRTGDDEIISAETLFQAHAQFVASFLHRFGTPLSDVDDLVQEVFIVAHRKGGYVRGPAQPRTWLAAIAVRIVQSDRRSRTRRARNTGRTLDDSPELANSGLDPHQQLEARRALERLQQALEGLPDEQRAAFMLYEIEGESCESIAAQWQVPIGTVYSRLHLARRRVSEAYAAVDPNHTSLVSQRRPLQHVSGER